MRINFLFTGTFWGVLLILLGLSALLRSFNINIPFGRIIFGLLIIYVGIVILSGGSVFTIDNNNVIFSDIDIKITDEISDEYNIIFGKGVIDLTEISPEMMGKEIEINTIFGAGEILIDPTKPVEIDLSSAFGKATLPDGNTVTFGDYNYSNKDKVDNQNAIEIEASVVFGNLEIRNIKR